MKHIKTLSLTLAFLMVLPLCYAAVGDKRNQTKSETYYTAEQVDSIVATRVDEAVKSAVMRELNMELIDLKIDKAANDKLGTYISQQNNQLTIHDIWLGAILTIFVGITGVVIPLIINRNNNARLKEIKAEVDDLAKQARESKEASEKSARESKFSEMLSQAWNEKDFNKQIEIVSQLIGEYPEQQFSSMAYYARGTFYGSKGFYDKSIDDYTEALKRNPEQASYYYNRGNMYDEKGEYDLAIADYTEALTRKPTNASYYCNRGVSYANKGDNDLAIADYTEALKRAPNNPTYYCNRGASYAQKGENELAIADYTKALNIDSDYASANNNLADVLCKLKRFGDALPYVNKAIEQKPDESVYYETRREVYEGLGQLKEALSNAKQSLEIAKRKGETKYIDEFEDHVKRLEESIKK